MSAQTGQAGNAADGKTSGAGGSGEEPGLLRKYFLTSDHKAIGILFWWTGLAMFLFGGVLALAVRWQLAYPNNLPGGPVLTAIGLTTKGYAFQPEIHARLVAIQEAGIEGRALTAAERELVATRPAVEAVFVKLAARDAALAGGVDGAGGAGAPAPLTAAEQALFDTYGEARYTMAGEVYNMLFTMHASVMVFLVIIPLLTGAFGNYLVPLQIGARRMAFPALNLASYWLLVVGLVTMVAGFFVAGGNASAGWTSYPPLANYQATGLFNPGSAGGQSCWLAGVCLLGLSAVAGAVNCVVTVAKMRAPGMRWSRLPLTTWSLFITAWLTLIGTPVLISAAVLLLADRAGWIAGGIFRADEGGRVLLWQHLFWFYGQPAMYIMILPAMGLVTDVLTTFARKTLFGYRSTVAALGALAGLGLISWGQHLYQAGMNPALGLTFMIPATLLAWPSAVLVFNWLATIWKSNTKLTPPMLCALAFVGLFIVGGLAGIFLALAPVDMFLHDTYFVVGHIHYVLFGGSMFAIFAAVQFWFPKMFGRMLNPALGYIHFAITFIGFNVCFFPMHILGLAGYPRRIVGSRWDALTGTGYQYLEPVQGLNTLMTHGAMLLAAGQIFLVVNLIWSLYRGPKASQNPWNANTLEWVSAPTPTLPGNFGPELPVVYNGPYEFGHPAVREDYLPQTRNVDQEAPGAP